MARKHSPARKKNEPQAATAIGIVAPPPIQVDAPAFRGSLAMLFECVRDRKIDLRLIPLAPICQAYHSYLLEMAEPDVDESAAALSALAYLLERKSWLLLPTDEPEPDDEIPLELADPTVDEYWPIIEALKKHREERERIFFRPSEAAPDAYETVAAFGDITASDLARALEELLLRASPEPPEAFSAEKPSLGDVMRSLLGRLTKSPQSLADLVPEPFTVQEAVFVFLALLELIRLGQAAVVMVESSVAFCAPK